MTTKWKIKFTRQGTVERAPKDKNKGGYETQIIPVGTEMEVNAASLQFWEARGCVQNLGRVDPPAPAAPKVAQSHAPFGTQPPSNDPRPMTKTALKPVLDAALAAFDAGKLEVLVDTLKTLEPALIEEALIDLPEDPHQVLKCAIDDVRSPEGRLRGNPGEIREALLDAIDVLLPPSRRTRVIPVRK